MVIEIFGRNNFRTILCKELDFAVFSLFQEIYPAYLYHTIKELNTELFEHLELNQIPLHFLVDSNILKNIQCRGFTVQVIKIFKHPEFLDEEVLLSSVLYKKNNYYFFAKISCLRFELFNGRYLEIERNAENDKYLTFFLYDNHHNHMYSKYIRKGKCRIHLKNKD